MAFWDKVKQALVGQPPSEDELRSIRAKSDTSAGTEAARTDTRAIAESVAEHSPLGTGGDSGVGDSGMYHRVHIKRGTRGWGGPIVVAPRPGKDLIYSVTGGGIHPVAQRIAELTGGTPFDGFKSKADFDQIAVAVIDCGGTARIGVYPMKGVLTVDIHGASPSGPLAKHIREDNFVSGITPEMVTLLDD